VIVEQTKLFVDNDLALDLEKRLALFDYENAGKILEKIKAQIDNTKKE
jgi:hypothetical protein